jgi:RNA polymerase sigma factor (sigma-70 family)
MGTGTITMAETRLSILARVRDLGDDEGWRDAHDLTQEVLFRLTEILPSFELNRNRGRFRTYLWTLTHNTFVNWVRSRKVRGRAEEEWERQYCEATESESHQLRERWIRRHRERLLEVVLPRVRATVSATSWDCFEQRLLRGRPAAEIAAKQGITADLVYVRASRVLKEVRRQCAELEEERGDESDYDLS